MSIIEFNSINTGISAQLHNRQDRILTPRFKGLNSSNAGVTDGYTASNGGRRKRPPPSDASARMPFIYRSSPLYTSRLSLLASPVYKVGGLAYVYSLGNA